MHKMVINQFPSVLAFWGGKWKNVLVPFPSSSLSLTRLISLIVSPSPPSALRNNKEKKREKKSVSLGLTGRVVYDYGVTG